MITDNTNIGHLCEDINTMFTKIKEINGESAASEAGEELDWNDICR